MPSPKGGPFVSNQTLNLWYFSYADLRISANGERRCVDSRRGDDVLVLPKDETQLGFRLWVTAVDDQRCDLAVRESLCGHGSCAGNAGRDVRPCELVAAHRIK